MSYLIEKSLFSMKKTKNHEKTLLYSYFLGNITNNNIINTNRDKRYIYFIHFSIKKFDF